MFVPTPLGNLRDVTLRALDVLREVPLIVAEDSRVARRLLSALDLGSKEIWTYQAHNARAVTPGILERARRVLVVGMHPELAAGALHDRRRLPPVIGVGMGADQQPDMFKAQVDLIQRALQLGQ